MPDLFHLLIERQHLQTMLHEARIDFLRQKYLPLIQKVIEGPGSLYKAIIKPEQLAPRIFDWAVNLDPDPTKKYAQWILNLVARNSLPMEDGYKVTQYLTSFERLKPQLPVEQRDINRYRSLEALYDAIDDQTVDKSQRQISREYDDEMNRQAVTVFDDASYKIVIPTTEEASCHFGRNTQWCTAASESDNAFNSYYQMGDLYIILDKRNNRRWQYQVQENQLMDERDAPINPHAFATSHPAIARFFAEAEKQNVFGIINGSFHYGLDERDDSVRARDLLAIKMRHGRGFVLKDQPGMAGHAYYWFTPQGEGYLTSHLYGSSRFDDGEVKLDPEQLAALLTKSGMEGSPGDKGILDVFWRKERWGTARDIGEVYAKTSNGAWYAVTVPSTQVTQLTYYENDEDVGMHATIDHGGGAEPVQTVTFFDYDTDNGKPFRSDLAMALIKARPEIEQMDVGRGHKFEELPEADQQWLLHNRPTMCPAWYVYENQGWSDAVRKLIDHDLEQVSHYQWARPLIAGLYLDQDVQDRHGWFGDKMVVESWDDIKTAIKDITAKWPPGVWSKVVSQVTLQTDPSFLKIVDKALKANKYTFYIENGKLRKGLKYDVPYVFAVPASIIVQLLKDPDQRFSWQFLKGRLIFASKNASKSVKRDT